MSGLNICEDGKACDAALTAPDSGAQGTQFLAIHTQHHGGRRTRRTRRHRMRGGAVAELADYPTSFTPSLIPEGLHGSAGVSPLDQAVAELAQFRQTGGRRTRRTRGGALGFGPADSGGPLIPADMEELTFQNPQWYNENLVNPMFVGPTVAKVGGAKKSRKYRKTHRKTKTSRKAHRKAHRKAQRKQKGGKSRKAHRKGTKRH